MSSLEGSRMQQADWHKHVCMYSMLYCSILKQLTSINTTAVGTLSTSTMMPPCVSPRGLGLHSPTSLPHSFHITDKGWGTYHMQWCDPGTVRETWFVRWTKSCKTKLWQLAHLWHIAKPYTQPLRLEPKSTPEVMFTYTVPNPTPNLYIWLCFKTYASSSPFLARSYNTCPWK